MEYSNFSMNSFLVRFDADNWNKLKNLCSKTIGAKMKVIIAILYIDLVCKKCMKIANSIPKGTIFLYMNAW